MKDQDVDEAHGKSAGVYSKGGVPHIEKNLIVWRVQVSAYFYATPTSSRSSVDAWYFTVASSLLPVDVPRQTSAVPRPRAPTRRPATGASPYPLRTGLRRP